MAASDADLARRMSALDARVGNLSDRIEEVLALIHPQPGARDPGPAPAAPRAIDEPQPSAGRRTFAGLFKALGVTGFDARLTRMTHEIQHAGDMRMDVLDARYHALKSQLMLVQDQLIALGQQIDRYTAHVDDRVGVALRGLEHSRQMIAETLLELGRTADDNDPSEGAESTGTDEVIDRAHGVRRQSSTPDALT